ncbi:hypothetical protein C8R46DRAFT_1212052 [Mycena filopes]|nr:hypothetical protein C8R46DRAFT_1212052 [Mycena filopes]
MGTPGILAENMPKRFVLHDKNLLEPSGDMQKKPSNNGSPLVDCAGLDQVLTCSPRRDLVHRASIRDNFATVDDPYERRGKEVARGRIRRRSADSFLARTQSERVPGFRTPPIRNANPPNARPNLPLPSRQFTFTSQSSTSAPPPSHTTLEPPSKRLRISPAPVWPRTRPSSVARDAQDPAARTRAATGASARQPEPRYTYSYDSLMRQPSNTERTLRPPHNDYSASAKQPELDAVRGLKLATVGTLGRKLEVDEPAIMGTLLERMHEHMEVDAEGERTWPLWIEPRPNTTPTVSYATMLQETFGPGSMLRGEGAKPLDTTNHRRKSGSVKSKSHRGSASASASNSGADVEMDVDTDGSTSADLEAERVATTTREWIGEIRTVVEVKRQLKREDLRTFEGTLKQIANMDKSEGRTLKGLKEYSQLLHSLRQLVQLDPEDIPFRDEYRVRRYARHLLKAFAAT